MQSRRPLVSPFSNRNLRMRLTVLLLLLLWIALHSELNAQENNAMVNPPIPKGAIHLTILSDKEAKQIFTYFPYPQAPDRYWLGGRTESGVYRLEVDTQGRVSAVTILKSMSPTMDVISMKTFVRWRAKPGPLRVVDVAWQLSTRILGPK